MSRSAPALPPVVVFDLDGTLVDSLPDIVASFRHAGRAVGAGSLDEGAVRALVGRPLEEMAAAFVEGERVTALADAYRAHYPRHFTDRSRPYPGVPDLLAALGERGYRRAVATTKRTGMARALVGALGLDGLLDAVQGTDGFAHKPDPEVIHRAVAAAGGRGVWMVGDTVTDVQAGRAAGFRTYAVSWGTHDAERLAAAGPDALAPDLDGLLDRLPPLPR